jgi:hypothetical protein
VVPMEGKVNFKPTVIQMQISCQVLQKISVRKLNGWSFDKYISHTMEAYWEREDTAPHIINNGSRRRVSGEMHITARSPPSIHW